MGIIGKCRWNRFFPQRFCSERTVSFMAEAVKSGRRRAASALDEERRQLMEGMAQTRSQLSCAYAQFNAYSDPDLVDACVYEINALQSRYSYYVRQVKRLEAAREGAG